MIFRTKPTNTPQGALAKLWRNIIKENNLQHSLSYLLTRYIAKNTGESKNLKRKTRSTLENDITAKEMTWKKFTHLVFHYLGAVRLDVTIKLTFANGSSSVHSIGIKSSANVDNDDIEKSKEAVKEKGE
jgi:hypothetical protein